MKLTKLTWWYGEENDGLHHLAKPVSYPALCGAKITYSSFGPPHPKYMCPECVEIAQREGWPYEVQRLKDRPTLSWLVYDPYFNQPMTRLEQRYARKAQRLLRKWKRRNRKEKRRQMRCARRLVRKAYRWLS